jgi:actin-related protein 9
LYVSFFLSLTASTVFKQEIPARVGLRRSGFGEHEIANGNSHLNGDFNGVEETFASTSRAPSIFTKTNASVSSYLVGLQLDEALASGQDISVFWPFADGEISDWTQAEAIWCVLPIHIS